MSRETDPSAWGGLWYDDGRVTFPEADDAVARYIEANAATRTHVTSNDVLKWAGIDPSAHNRTRVFDALADRLPEAEAAWGGRKAFELPEETTTND